MLMGMIGGLNGHHVDLDLISRGDVRIPECDSIAAAATADSVGDQAFGRAS